MKNLLNNLLAKANKFTISDYVFFKIVLCSIGILLGAYFAEFFKANILFIWILFVVSYISLIFRIVKNN